LQVIKLFLSRIPITQRHPAFRNNPLQKLQQTISGDVMANEQTYVSRVADRGELALLLDCLTLQAAPMNWWTLALPSVMRRFETRANGKEPFV
jgi:hypothetical protein